MEINILDPSSDITSLTGFTIVVDVFRAFSVSYYIADNKPQKYIAIDSVEEAFELKKQYKNVFLIGERNGIKIEGFDFGNSPTEIKGKNFSNHTIIHTTSAGTKGLLKQPINNLVVVGSFVNVNALIKYIRKNNINIVNIYCTANKNELFGEEDFYFAEYLAKRLKNESIDFKEIKKTLRKGSGKGFSKNGFAPYSDFKYCMKLSVFNNILVRKIDKERRDIIILENLV